MRKNEVEMREVKLFEIHIYSYSKEVFTQKVERCKEKYIQDKLNARYTYDKAEGLFRDFHNKEYVWDYNQVVGVIKIFIREMNDIAFEVYLPDEEVRYNSTKKHFMRDRTPNNMHFDTYGMSNNEIAKAIKNKLEYFVKNHLKKNRYLDLEIFNNQYMDLDYEKQMLLLEKKFAND